jgi:uncharacterized membrane protein YcaP (DUF421 family)
VHFWLPEIPLVEKIVRSIVIYGFLLGAFRLVGKRQLGQMTPFDLVVLLIISNVVQNALIGNDNSLGGGLVGATTILAVNALVARVTYRFKPIQRVVEHTPRSWCVTAGSCGRISPASTSACRNSTQRCVGKAS